MSLIKFTTRLIAALSMGAVLQPVAAAQTDVQVQPVQIMQDGMDVYLTYNFDGVASEAALDEATYALTQHMEANQSPSFTVTRVQATDLGGASAGFSITCGRVLCASGADLSAATAGTITIRAAMTEAKGQVFQTAALSEQFAPAPVTKFANAEQQNTYAP